MGMVRRQEKQDGKKARVLLKMSTEKRLTRLGLYVNLYKTVQQSHFCTEISTGRYLPNCCDLHGTLILSLPGQL